MASVFRARRPVARATVFRRPSLPIAVGLLLTAACAHSTSSMSGSSVAPSSSKSATAPSPDPRVGLKAGLHERAGGGVESPRRVADAAVGEVRRHHELRSRLHGQLRDPGELHGYQIWDISNPAHVDAQDGVLLPGVAERRVGLQESALRFRRGAHGPPRLRRRRREGHGEQGAHARHSHLRHHRHRESEERRQRADVPRLAHAHRARRPEGSGQRLHLHLRLVARSLVERAPGLRQRRAATRIRTRRSSASR